MNQRFRLYRSLARLLSPGKKISDVPPIEGGVWFHASSAGELEALIPVIEALRAKHDRGHVSVFSRSGAKGIEKLRAQWGVQTGWSIDFSPREGQWWEVLTRARPAAIVTYKYEAWPELWASASLLNIPITVIGAQDRPSLRWASRLLRALGVALPRLRWGVFDPTCELPLRARFVQSEIRVIPNPRWHRAAERVGGEPSARGREVRALLAAEPGPRLFLSQIWNSDLKILDLKESWAGSLVVAPHSLAEDQLSGVAESLEAAGYAVLWTRPSPDRHPVAKKNARRVWIVNEVGILPELYPLMDVVYVGGGFEKGVHSTIEPAVEGLPIACGPYRAERFEEIAQLQAQGQLNLLRSATEWRRWCKQVAEISKARREEWRAHWRQTQVQVVSQTDWAQFILC